MDSSGESRNRQKGTYTLQFKYFDKIYRSSPWLGGNGRMGTLVYHTVNSESDVCVPTRRMCGGRPRALFGQKATLSAKRASGQAAISASDWTDYHLLLFPDTHPRSAAEFAIRRAVRVEPLPAHALSHEHILNLRGAHFCSLPLFVS